MFELTQLEQLLAIHQYRTLSKAAEALNLSQPALSRSMQRLEDELGVELFERKKNKIAFNEYGLLALDYARRILGTSRELKDTLQTLARSKRTISIGSCAPAPMWMLTPHISNLVPDMSIQSELASYEALEKGLEENTYQIIITTKETHHPNRICQKLCEENLYVALPTTHPLATRESMTLNELDGQSILIFSNLGFWFDICKEKLPNSRFLMQDDLAALATLIRSSDLPGFATNLTIGSANIDYDMERVLVPLSDPEVNVTFYMHYKPEYKKLFGKIPPLA